MASEHELDELKMDPSSMYREEVFTDRRVGTIRRLTPVAGGGSEDSKRPVLYLGDTQILTPMGAIPLSFEIEASTLEEAVQKFGAHAKKALEDTAREIQEMRREAASQIIVPSMAPGGLTGGKGGLGGGGLIRP